MHGQIVFSEDNVRLAEFSGFFLNKLLVGAGDFLRGDIFVELLVVLRAHEDVF